MGGGSADAAGVLVALDALYDTRLDTAALCRIGLTVGADVPFCLVGGTAYVTGIGEEIAPLPALPDCAIVVAQPDEGVSTAAAYAALDRAVPARRPDHTALLAALRQGDLAGVCRAGANVFEEALALSSVAAIRDRMAAHRPLLCQMTGSGSAVFAVFPPARAADATACRDDLARDWPGAFLCAPCAGPTRRAPDGA